MLSKKADRAEKAMVDLRAAFRNQVLVDRRMVDVATARLWRDPISEPADGELSLRGPLALV